MGTEIDNSTAESGAPSSASLRSVFGAALGLAVLLACIGALVGYGSRIATAGPTLAENYELSELPFGFRLHPDVFLLPGGERVFVLHGEASENPDPVQDLAPANKKPIDWSKVEAIASDGPPSRIFLVQYPKSRSEDVIKGHFRSLEWKDLRKLESKGEQTTVDGGKLQWSGYSADFVRKRDYRRPGTFVDRVYVNLTLGGDCWIAYALWPELHAGSEEPVEELLAALRPLE